MGQSGVPSTRRPVTIPPNGPHDRFPGPNGVKESYGGANPSPSPSGGGSAPSDTNGSSSYPSGPQNPVPGQYSPGGRDPTIPGGTSQPPMTGEGSQNNAEGVEQGQQCGMSNANGLQHFEGDSTETAKPGQYPWAVALIHEKKYLAGGSLIRPGVVLTAAHRVVDKNAAKIVVRAGDWDLVNNTERFKIEQREVVRIKIHEEFQFSSGANNLALLFLKSDFQMSDNIRTICLPDPRKTFEGRRCIVAGWGKISFQDKSFSTILKKVELPMVDKRTCQNQLRQTGLGPNYQLPESLICAGGELNRDACYGDGGSALFCSVGGENSGVFEQAGIVNWGIECGQVELRILGRNTCQNELRRTIDMGNYYTLPQSLICTRGVAGVSLAAGSPLFCSIDEKNPSIYEQVGIVSWVKDCGQNGVLETYTDVFMFMEWITSRIGT